MADNIEHSHSASEWQYEDTELLWVGRSFSAKRGQQHQEDGIKLDA